MKSLRLLFIIFLGLIINVNFSFAEKKVLKKNGQSIVKSKTIGSIIKKFNKPSGSVRKIFPANLNKKNYLLGKFKPTRKNDFKPIPSKYTNGRKMFLRREVVNAFVRMAKAAEKDGIHFKSVSAFRSFWHQAAIFGSKYSGKRKVGGVRLNRAIPQPEKRIKKIMLYSSMPGTSRHHWGTDLDINSLNSSYFKHGKGLKEFNWLEKNAKKYGFIRPYSEGRKFGYNVEEWHWSYYPISIELLKAYNKLIKPKDINGFEGSKYVKKLKIIEKYVNGINPELIPKNMKH